MTAARVRDNVVTLCATTYSGHGASRWFWLGAVCLGKAGMAR